MGFLKKLSIEQQEAEAARQVREMSVASQGGDGKEELFEPLSTNKTKKNKNLVDVERTIEFHKAFRTDTSGDKVKAYTFDPLIFISEFDEAIKAHPEKRRTQKLEMGDNDYFITYEKRADFALDNGEPMQAFLFHMYKIRRAVRSGQVDPSTYEFSGYSLGEKESAEASHCVLFSDGYVALEFNQIAPKLAVLEELIRTKFHRAGVVKFKPCVLRNHVENLKNAQVKSIVFEVTPTTIDLYNEINSDFGLVSKWEQDEIESLGKIKISINAKPRKNLNVLAEKVVSRLGKGKNLKDVKANKMLSINSPRKEAVSRNLMDIFACRVTALKTIKFGSPVSHHQLDKDHALEQMIDAYKVKRTQLRKSVSLDQVYGEPS